MSIVKLSFIRKEKNTSKLFFYLIKIMNVEIISIDGVIQVKNKSFNESNNNVKNGTVDKIRKVLKFCFI